MRRALDDVVEAPFLGVEVLQWPAEEVLRRRLARAGVPRLLLVAEGASPPGATTLDEAWVLLPADDREIRRCAERLIGALFQVASEPPVLDDGVVRQGDVSVVLTAAQAIVASMLLEVPGRVVTFTELERALWPDGRPRGRKAVSSLVYRLRSQIAGMPIRIRAVRGRGFMLLVDRPASVRIEP